MNPCQKKSILLILLSECPLKKIHFTLFHRITKKKNLLENTTGLLFIITKLLSTTIRELDGEVGV